MRTTAMVLIAAGGILAWRFLHHWRLAWDLDAADWAAYARRDHSSED